MRHRNKVLKLNRENGHRKALVRNLLTSLVLHERLTTTRPRAKVISQEFDRLMTQLKREEKFNQIRTVKKKFYKELPGKKVIEVLLPRFESRASGCTRIVKMPNRKGDNAPMVLIEFV